jgi:hypothetical protein
MECPDEAVVALADFLGELLMQFESRNLPQNLGYRHDHRLEPPDPRPPWLTGLPPPDEPF